METIRASGALDRSTPVTNLLKGSFLVAGSTWNLNCDSPEILHTMEDVFQPVHSRISSSLSLHLTVNTRLSAGPRWRQPFFRALDHLYYASYGPNDALLMDQIERRVIGSFSIATARDRDYWERVILPVLLGIASASLGVTPVHCGCVAKDGNGLLLCGESGVGKSTLSLALALEGFSYVSDDCTYISRSSSGLQAWGSSAPVKLMPDAVAHFPQLHQLNPAASLNGELAYEVDPATLFGVERSTSCEPRRLVFVERVSLGSPPIFRPMNRAEAAARLAVDLEELPPCLAHQYDYQLGTLAALVASDCWVLTHGLPPARLARFLANAWNCG